MNTYNLYAIRGKTKVKVLEDYPLKEVLSTINSYRRRYPDETFAFGRSDCSIATAVRPYDEIGEVDVLNLISMTRG